MACKIITKEYNNLLLNLQKDLKKLNKMQKKVGAKDFVKTYLNAVLVNHKTNLKLSKIIMNSYNKKGNSKSW